MSSEEKAQEVGLNYDKQAKKKECKTSEKPHEQRAAEQRKKLD
jgi:hypothetical protein